jgi:biopolymer transport protein ExbD
MRRKIAISIAVVAMLLIGIMVTSVFASDAALANISSAKKANAANQLQANAVTVTPEQTSPIREQTHEQLQAQEQTKEQLQEQTQNQETNQVGEPPENDVNVAELEKTVPRTYEEADARLVPTRTRFLMYTHDGKHIMWGWVGNGYFVGTDNMGKRCWGIYGNGVFAGFYDGDFFWGRYRNGNWKAEGLFGEKYTYGKYVLFPIPTLEPAITAAVP